MFPAFVENPQNLRFEGQDLDEKIVLLLRAHPITNLTWIIPAIFLFFLPFFLPDLLLFLGWDLSFVPPQFATVYLIINYLLVLVITFEGFLNWYFNVYMVTSKNIVDIDFHSLLFKNIDLAPLRNVEETSSNMGGIIRAIFNFGHVYIQTAGSKQTIDFPNVPNPHRVSDMILDQSHRSHRG